MFYQVGVFVVTIFFSGLILAQELGGNEERHAGQEMACSEVDFGSTKVVSKGNFFDAIGNMPLAIVHYDGSTPIIEISLSVSDDYCVGIESVDGANQPAERSQLQEINSVFTNNSPTYKSNSFDVTSKFSSGLWVFACVKASGECYSDGVVLYVGTSS